MTKMSLNISYKTYLCTVKSPPAVALLPCMSSNECVSPLMQPQHNTPPTYELFTFITLDSSNTSLKVNYLFYISKLYFSISVLYGLECYHREKS